ncbi:hypothetical protein FHT00_001689 [Sphingomonas insulae]|uniref:SGNH hydrolase-type esterase domain-containing protein n=1 Tax=Sphingomonas insulae TaxID=424800 RepID=A0ABP3T0X6_9SPHN|nr:hypothetical protein [Sphingomonas insulae]NIJ29742.1 hypothetical protein [Sphingomonas insulae]
MAKISLLPELDAPDGSERVPVLVGDKTMAASMSGLVEGAVGGLAADLGITDAPGGWKDVVIDRDGRIVSGYHPLRGEYQPSVDAVDDRLALLELAAPRLVAQIGGWISAEVDEEGRVVRGVHATRGAYPPPSDIDDAADMALVRRALVAAQLRGLRLEAAPTVHLTPPRVFRRETGSPVIPAGQRMTLDLLDARLSFGHAPVRRGASGWTADYLRGQWVSAYGSREGATQWSVRFVTDSPQIELPITGGQIVRVWIDDQPASLGNTVDLPADNEYLACIDFGEDMRPIRPRAAIAAAGTGYVEGDALSVSGIKLVVRAVTATGAIASVSIEGFGQLTVLPSAPVAAMGGSGNGATFALSDSLGGVSQSGHTSRRMRRVEVVFGGGNGFLGRIRLTSGSTVRRWPVAGPRLVTMQDSWGQIYSDAIDGSWAQTAGRMIGIQDVWQNSVGGTGFTNGSANTPRYMDRLVDLADAADTAGRPIVFLTQGSINDDYTDASDAALQAAVEAYWRAAWARLPAGTIMIQTGVMRRVDGGSPDTRSAAVRQGFVAVAADLDPKGLRSGFIETRGLMNVATNGPFWMTGDGAHMTQLGHDMVACAMAAELIQIFQSLPIY